MQPLKTYPLMLLVVTLLIGCGGQSKCQSSLPRVEPVQAVVGGNEGCPTEWAICLDPLQASKLHGNLVRLLRFAKQCSAPPAAPVESARGSSEKGSSL